MEGADVDEKTVGRTEKIDLIEMHREVWELKRTKMDFWSWRRNQKVDLEGVV